VGAGAPTPDDTTPSDSSGPDRKPRARHRVRQDCPRRALSQFADADITNQQLIDQSIVLVNGVRIALNLQTAE